MGAGSPREGPRQQRSSPPAALVRVLSRVRALDEARFCRAWDLLPGTMPPGTRQLTEQNVGQRGRWALGLGPRAWPCRGCADLSELCKLLMGSEIKGRAGGRGEDLL